MLPLEELKELCFPFLASPRKGGATLKPSSAFFGGRPAAVAGNDSLAVLVTGEYEGLDSGPCPELVEAFDFIEAEKAERRLMEPFVDWLGAGLDLAHCVCVGAGSGGCARCFGSSLRPQEPDEHDRPVQLHAVDFWPCLAATALERLMPRFDDEWVMVGRGLALDGRSLVFAGKLWRVLVAGLETSPSSETLKSAGFCPGGRIGG